MAEGWNPPVEKWQVEPWSHVIMANIGRELERYDVVADTVAFFKLATWCEGQLREAEIREQMIEEMRSKSKA